MTDPSTKRLLLINVAGLARDGVGAHTPGLQRLGESGVVAPVEPPVPGLTSVSQATLLTGTDPSHHGVIANGWYFRDLSLILNWQRSAHLVHGEKLWEKVRRDRPDFRSASLFMRHATHCTADAVIVERPVYWADGRKSPGVYAHPTAFGDDLTRALGPFPLFNFWGPMAGIESTRWIVDATLRVIDSPDYHFVTTYLPHLDYEHQRHGPDSPQGLAALRDLDTEAARLIDRATTLGWDIAVVGDYAFEPVSRAVYPNRELRKRGWLTVHHAANGELLEPGDSTAFAVCDQQTAHVYVNDASKLAEVRTCLESLDGVETVMGRDAMRDHGIDHERSGELLIIAAEGCWFAYPYWLDESNAPDFAGCVAIHDKPGFDPVELFMSPGLAGSAKLAKRVAQKVLGFRAPFDVIARDDKLVRGAHGRIPTEDKLRAAMILSWQSELPDAAIAMRDVTSLFIDRMLG